MLNNQFYNNSKLISITMLSPFHLAIPVTCLIKANDFYGNVLGLNKGRESIHWIDWDFFGHQLVTHLHATLNKRILKGNNLKKLVVNEKNRKIIS